MNIEIKDEIERIIRTWGWHQAMPLSEAADEIIKLFPDAPAWKDVRDELPQYGQGVIAYCQFQSDEKYELDIVYLELNDKWISTKIGCEVDVLYWLPLPAPPDTKEG